MCIRDSLIAWEHCMIPLLRAALGCATNRCAACWNDDNYDSLDRFRVTYANDSTVDAIVMLPPQAEGFDPAQIDYDFYLGMCLKKNATCVPPASYYQQQERQRQQQQQQQQQQQEQAQQAAAALQQQQQKTK